MKVAIVTPSFRQPEWLRRCMASVADQQGVDVEHIVQDNNSGPDVQAVARDFPRASFFSEADRGMYDAVDRGLAKATGDILGYLNCDEQYLPGTLAFVADFFVGRPDVDILFGSVLLVRPDGTLLAYRKAYPLRRAYLATGHLYLLSCAMFWRRSIWDAGLRFDPAMRDAGDHDFVLRALDRGYRSAWTSRYLACFAATGANMSMGENARREGRLVLRRAPVALRVLAPLMTVIRRLEKWFRGGYSQRWPLCYSLYLGDARNGRTEFESGPVSFRWRL